MNTTNRTSLATAALSVTAALVVSTAWAKPMSAKDTCLSKAYNAYSNCAKAGISSDYCLDISNRTFDNCMQRLGQKTGGASAEGAGDASPTPTPTPARKSAAILTVGGSHSAANGSAWTMQRPAAQPITEQHAKVDTSFAFRTTPFNPEPMRKQAATSITQYHAPVVTFTMRTTPSNPEPTTKPIASIDASAHHAPLAGANGPSLKHDRKR